MHLLKDSIIQIAQEGTKLSEEEQRHLKQCEECANLFRMFVLYRYYTKRTYEPSLARVQA